MTIYRASDISSSTFLSSKASTSITWREWICNNGMAMWINLKHLANLWSISKDSVIKLMHSRSLRDMHPPQTIYKASHSVARPYGNFTIFKVPLKSWNLWCNDNHMNHYKAFNEVFLLRLNHSLVNSEIIQCIWCIALFSYLTYICVLHMKPTFIWERERCNTTNVYNFSRQRHSCSHYNNTFR